MIFKLALRKIVKFNSYDSFYKIVKQKKQKWQPIILLTENQFKSSKFKKYRLIDQHKIVINTFSNKLNSYKKKYKENFLFYKKINFFFSGNKKLKYLLKGSKQVTEFFENRLDFIIFKIKFCLSIKSACSYIQSGFVLVNKKKLNLKTYVIQSGDHVKLNLKSNDYRYNLVKSNKWSLLTQNVAINYKTKEFIFLTNKTNSYLNYFPIHLKLFE